MADEKLIKAYEKVFDAQGETKPCGRDACISLIEECEKAAPQIYFGDSQTGRMDTTAIKDLVEHKKRS